MIDTRRTTHVDSEELNALVKEHYLTCRAHPTSNLLIWNYTPKTLYGNHWTPETRMCRGLITTREGEIRARPFPKFFSLEQHTQQFGLDLPNEPFKVTSKEDGCLGVLFWDDDGLPAIATRGSFVSVQAQKATAIFRVKYGMFTLNQRYTYLFEIISPESQIVVNYGGMEDLILLGMIDTKTGKEEDIHHPLVTLTCPFPIVKWYDGATDLEAIRDLDTDSNREGFVICFESGLRLKVKFAEYQRIHRIISQTSSKVIWQHMKEGRSLEELYDRVPVEFCKWAKQISQELGRTYSRIYRQSNERYKEIEQRVRIMPPCVIGDTLGTKEVRMFVHTMKLAMQQEFTQYPELAFFLQMLYNGQKEKLAAAIWDSLEPVYSRPYWDEDHETRVTDTIRKDEGGMEGTL